MRLLRIQVQGFRSLRDFTWDNLDMRLNIIVGPNGAGKSNLFAALRAGLGLLIDGNVSRELGALAEPFTLSLDIELTASWERALLRTFIAGVLASGESLDGPAQGHLSTILLDAITDADIADLCIGRLTMRYHGEGGWEAQYEALPDHRAFFLELKGQRDSWLMTHRPDNNQSVRVAQWPLPLAGTDHDRIVEFTRGHNQTLGHIELDLLHSLDVYTSELTSISLVLRGHPRLAAHRAFERLADIRIGEGWLRD